MIITTFGLRRVGNHLIRRWINPSNSSRHHVFLNGIGQTRHLNVPMDEGVVTVGVEDGSYRQAALQDRMTPLLSVSAKLVHVVRDPINSIASQFRLTKNSRGPNPIPRQQPFQEQRRAPLLGVPSPIILQSMLFADFTETPPGGRVVIYEHFLESYQYRNDLAQYLEIDPHEEQLFYHSRELGGSSFTGNTVPPEEMPVNERWLSFVDDPEYLWYLKYPGLLEAREKVYGPLPPELEEALR